MKALKKIREQVEKGGQNQGIFACSFAKSQALYGIFACSIEVIQ